MTLQIQNKPPEYIQEHIDWLLAEIKKAHTKQELEYIAHKLQGLRRVQDRYLNEHK